MAADNNRLHTAKANKNDEFYTSLKDIEDELVYYREHFRGKTIFLNCDDPDYSNFWRWFENRFESLKLKKLISTHYEMNGSPSYKLEMILNPDGGDPIKNKIPLEGDGDFRSDECIELLKEADIVVTNPPFSLFREYVSQLMEYNKKFLTCAAFISLLTMLLETTSIAFHYAFQSVRVVLFVVIACF